MSETGFYGADLPAIHDGAVYCIDRAGILRALDAGTLAPQWKLRVLRNPGIENDISHPDFNVLTATFHHPPIIARGHLVVSATDGEIAAVDIRQRKVAWSRRELVKAPLPPVSANGMVYLALGTVVHAFAIASGRLVWRRDVRGKPERVERIGVSILGGRLAVVKFTRGYEVYDNTHRLRFSILARYATPYGPVLAGRACNYYMADDGGIHKLCSDGRLRLVGKFPEFSYSADKACGWIYASGQTRIYAIRASDGRRGWSRDLGNYSSVSAVSEGELLVLVRGGRLLLLRRPAWYPKTRSRVSRGTVGSSAGAVTRIP